MSEIKNREHILEAIDQLRRRKARPDIHRICNFISRRFSVDSKDTKADLQKCVDNEIVYKVEYKGNISYRNAAKKSYGIIRREVRDIIDPNTTITTNTTTKIDTTKSFASILTTALADLILSDSDYLDFGVPASELIKKILAKRECKFSKKTLTELLRKEVDSGGLIKMENGNFSLGPSSQNENDVDTEFLDEQKSNNAIKIRRKPGPKPGKRKNDMEKLRNYEVNNVGIRSGGRRKRAKKVFDPSDNNLPRVRKRGRPLGSLNKSTIEKQTALLNARSTDSPNTPRPMSRADSITGSKDISNISPGSQTGSILNTISPVGVCSICHVQGRKGLSDKMINCRECSNKAHVSCLDSEDAMLKIDPDNTWQCPQCKTCVVCFETSDAGSLTVCSICTDAYHSYCHEPKIFDKKSGFRWVCNNCQMEPLLSNDIKPKIEVKEEEPDLFDDKMCFNMAIDQNSTLSDSEESSQFLQSPAVSPTPPTLSPQAILNGTRSSSSTEYKFNLSDSQSLRDFDQEERFDPTIPDASNWSFDEVYNYFFQYFPEEAIVFKEQEIDGHSLLLMKRVDVLTSLNLKLGPALKIYRHVIKLQVRRDDHKLYWL